MKFSKQVSSNEGGRVVEWTLLLSDMGETSFKTLALAKKYAREHANTLDSHYIQGYDTDGTPSMEVEIIL